MNDPRLIPFREYMRRSRPWWWWLNPWGYADALEIIQAEAFRAAAGPEAPPPTSDAVRCAWCGAALAQDPDAPHRWRCDRAVQGKCVARGYWYVLCDDLAGVREAALVTDTAGTPSDAVREAAERHRVEADHRCDLDLLRSARLYFADGHPMRLAIERTLAERPGLSSARGAKGGTE